jgi:DNA-directed RNA polymerase specialized sigma24 family protein
VLQVYFSAYWKESILSEDYLNGGEIRFLDSAELLESARMRCMQGSSLHGAAVRRLARGDGADPDKQKDLLQEIHMELWKSLGSFDGRCSLRTWVYRVAHNVGASHLVRSRRLSSRLTDLKT